jgi:hypothetical protein
MPAKRTRWWDGAQAAYFSLMAGSAGVAALTVWFILHGPGIRAEAEQQSLAEAEAESQVVCHRLGLEADRYAACAAELNRVWRQHEQRMDRCSPGALD